MSNELTMKQKREYAETLYLRGQLSQRDIAAKVGVSEVTISKWSKKDDWEKLRKSLLTKKSELLSFLYDLLGKIKDQITEQKNTGDSKDADKFVKYTAAIKTLETETSIAELMDAGDRFNKYLRLRDPQKAMEFLNEYDSFIKEQLKSF